jgi:hypothetical protein
MTMSINLSEIHMISNKKIKEIIANNGEFFTFVMENDVPAILDYTFIDKEVEIKDEKLIFGGKKEKKIVKSIAELRELIKELIVNISKLLRDYLLMFWKEHLPPVVDGEFLNRFKQNYNIKIDVSSFSRESFLNEAKTSFTLKSEDAELLVNQLIADILYNKYLDDTKITLNEYCEKYICYDLDNSFRQKMKKIKKELECEYADNKKMYIFLYKESRIEEIKKEKAAVYNKMDRRIKSYVKMMGTPNNKKDLLERVLFPDVYIEYIKEKNVKKPKWIWDLIYFNETLSAFKLYKRDTLNDSEDDLKKIAEELKEYDRFVQKAFKPIDGDNKDYFHKTMSFYYLESVSGLEFSYKLAERLEFEELNNMNNCSFLVKMFYVDVCCPVYHKIDGDEYFSFLRKRNTYGSTPLMNEAWLQKTNYKINKPDDNPFIQKSINLIRAQVYELFMYHYTFQSENYDEISEFIKEKFNLLDEYYKKNKIYENVKKLKPLSPEQMMRISLILRIRNTMFHKFNKENVNRWINSDYKKDSDYQRNFGHNKESFEMCLALLENAHKELHATGGRPSKLSVLDKFLMVIEHIRYDRTIESIAADYGVAKSRISESIKWVCDVLCDDK